MQTMKERFTQWLLGLAAAAFVAWAGVVWTATDTAKTLFIRIDEKLAAMIERMDRMQRELDEHEALPGHPGSMNQHSAEQAQIQGLTDSLHRHEAASDARLERIERKADGQR